MCVCVMCDMMCSVVAMCSCLASCHERRDSFFKTGLMSENGGFDDVTLLFLWFLRTTIVDFGGKMFHVSMDLPSYPPLIAEPDIPKRSTAHCERDFVRRLIPPRGWHGVAGLGKWSSFFLLTLILPHVGHSQGGWLSSFFSRIHTSIDQSIKQSSKQSTPPPLVIPCVWVCGYTYPEIHCFCCASSLTRTSLSSSLDFPSPPTP